MRAKSKLKPGDWVFCPEPLGFYTASACIEGPCSEAPKAHFFVGLIPHDKGIKIWNQDEINEALHNKGDWPVKSFLPELAVKLPEDFKIAAV